MIVPGSVNSVLWGSGDPLDELGKIERSLRARASASGHLVRLFSAGGNRKTFTLNDWVTWHGQTIYLLVADSVTPGTGGDWGLIQINSNGQFVFSTTANNTSFVTTRLLRDPGAKYNINVAIDTTQAALADRVKISINSELAAGTWSGAGIAQNADTYFMAARNHSMFRLYDGINTSYSGGQSAARVVVDGQALPPTAFGQYHPRTGQWRPKTKAAIRAAVAAAGGVRNGWGVNGVFLTYDDTSSVEALGYDRSQLDTDTTGNNWTPNNISLTPGATYDSMRDTPTDVFCTLNPLDTGGTVNTGNLLFTAPATGIGKAKGTQYVSSGKWYWENYFTNTNGNLSVGIVTAAAPLNTYVGAETSSYGYVASNGNKYNNGTAVGYGATYGTGDTIGVALDLDAGTLSFYKNGVFQGVAFSGLVGSFCPALSDIDSANTSSCYANFGQQPFSYTPPVGFKAISTKNLTVHYPVMRSADAFVCKTDSGTNIKAVLEAASTWDKWIRIYKRRDAAEGWRWQFWDDSGSYLDSSSTAAKAAFPALSGTSYVGYALKVSAQNGIATGRLAHTNGVAYTVADGLANSRKMVILVNEAGSNWFVFHPDLTAGKLLYLNLTNAEAADATISAVTPSGFTVGAALPSGNYRWISIAEGGSIALGKYTGNGLSNGPFAHCGGRPELFMQKESSGSPTTQTNCDWYMADTERSKSNPVSLILTPNKNSVETQIVAEDLNSNGVTLRQALSDGINYAACNYVYLAFIQPFRYTNAR